MVLKLGELFSPGAMPSAHFNNNPVFIATSLARPLPLKRIARASPSRLCPSQCAGLAGVFAGLCARAAQGPPLHIAAVTPLPSVMM